MKANLGALNTPLGSSGTVSTFVGSMKKKRAKLWGSRCVNIGCIALPAPLHPKPLNP